MKTIHIPAHDISARLIDEMSMATTLVDNLTEAIIGLSHNRKYVAMCVTIKFMTKEDADKQMTELKTAIKDKKAEIEENVTEKYIH